MLTITQTQATKQHIEDLDKAKAETAEQKQLAEAAEAKFQVPQLLITPERHKTHVLGCVTLIK